MLRFVQIAIQAAADAVRWWTLAFRSTRSINAENLFLRRQLALYIERGVKPRHPHPNSRHRHGESYAVLANPILGGLHHEYFLEPVYA
jgi:hypothetical protein